MPTAARGRVLYFCPDYAFPSGGVRRLYRHVHHLCRMGVDAVLVHQARPFTATWHGYRVPTAWLSERLLVRAQDIAVCPESMPSLLRRLQETRCRRVVCALSWAPQNLRLKPGESWRDYGASEVITPSAVIAEYIEWTMGLKATLIPSFVDPALFHPAAKTDSIVFMSRKDQAGLVLAAAFRDRGFAWVPCDALPEVEYAAKLREARLYLSPSPMEGLNVAVLEAMAAGCLVVGFHGVGGREYMRGAGPQQNCVLVENGDLPAFGPALERVLRELGKERDAFAPVIANALETAKPHLDAEREAHALADYYTRLLEG